MGDLPRAMGGMAGLGGLGGEKKLHGLKQRPLQKRILCLVFTMMVG